MKTQAIYFPNLNGIRFIAACLVIIHHIEQLKYLFNIPSYWDTPFIRVLGPLGVVLFFALSGFLITYLLLSEERNNDQNINIGNFYVRRVLRIWPLYFLIILLALFVLPRISVMAIPGYEPRVVYRHLIVNIVLFVLFLPNLVLSLGRFVPYASQTWSIGTEEQFYLVWPAILKFVKKERVLLMIAIVLSHLLVQALLSSRLAGFVPHSRILAVFWSMFSIQCMAIGGLLAILLFQNSPLLKFLLNRFLFFSVLVAVIVMLALGIQVRYVNHELYAILFGILILNFAANDAIGVSLENDSLNYLGSISYGLYMYHAIAIVLVLLSAKALHWVSNWFIYPSSLVLSVAIAGLSYKYFESFFLRFKGRFSSILSGDSTRSHGA